MVYFGKVEEVSLERLKEIVLREKKEKAEERDRE
jgi:hypothetical protein